MTVLKLGIDNGNYNTKSSERMLYASGFTRSDREFITDDMQLFYDGSYYAVGGKRMSFQQDKGGRHLHPFIACCRRCDEARGYFNLRYTR